MKYKSKYTQLPAFVKFSFFIKLTMALMLLTGLVYSAQPNLNGSLDTTFNAGVTKGDPGVFVTRPLADGKILVGGSFSNVNGSDQLNLIRLNSDGSADNTFNPAGTGPNAGVLDILILPDGKFLIGGSFTSYNGSTQRGIVRINSDGSLDGTFNSGATGAGGNVHTITRQTDGKILISGSLSSYNGTALFGVIRLNADGTTDSSFTSPLSSSQFVEEVDIQTDGKILIGGTFNLGPRNNIARLNSDGSIDETFATTDGSTAVYAMTIQSDGKILIGGILNGIGGVPGASTRRLNADGSTDSSFTTGAAIIHNQSEYFAVQTDGKILTAGTFSNDGLNALALLRLNADGSQDNSFSIPIANNRSYHVSLQTNGKILLGGEFLTVSGQSKPGLVRLNADGTVDSSFSASFYGTTFVYSLAQQPDGKILVGGSYNFANGDPRSNIARFNPDGTHDSSFNPGTGLLPDFASGTKTLYDIELQPDGKILMAGIFGGINGVKRRSIARLNSDGTVDSSFEAQTFMSAGFASVWDIAALPDGNILASTLTTDPFTGFGYFGLVKLTSNGASANDFASVEGLTRKILRQPDGKIIIAGQFTHVNGQPMNRIARLNPDGSTDSSFNIGSGFNGTVLDVALQPDGKLVVGGTFVSFNGTARNRVARLNSNGSLDTSFDPGSGANSTVWDVAVHQSGKIFLGGSFSSINGVGRNRVGGLKSDGSLDTGFGSGLDNTPANIVRTMLVQADGKLVLGGFFNSYSGQQRNSLARLSTQQARSTMFDFDGDSKTDISIFRPGSGQWWYLKSSDGGNRAFQFGTSSDKIVAADYTGDGKADVAFWRESSGEWFILRSENESFYSFPFGASGDIPAPGDFDGDGKADPAVFRPSNSTWYILNSGGGTTIATFGASGDRPVAADYDGDGKTDIAIFRPSDGSWWLNRSSAGTVVYNFGTASDKAIPADYTGDGKADVAFFRPTSGTWFVLRSENSSFYSFPFGLSQDIPVPGDYDGDGRADPAVFRPSNNTWYKLQTTSGFEAITFGTANDVPVPNAFVR